MSMLEILLSRLSGRCRVSDFKTQVTEWVRASDSRMLAVARESLQRVVALMQSRIPVDTGFARASVRASLTSMPQVNTSATRDEKLTYSYDSSAVVAVIARAKLGETVFVGWTANYVEDLELGKSRQAPSGFIRVSAMEWPRIVHEVCAAARQQARGA